MSEEHRHLAVPSNSLCGQLDLPSRREARRAFYRRARLLYDFDVNGSHVEVLHALLLMSFWYEDPDDSKDAGYWLGAQVFHAQQFGLQEKALSVQPYRSFYRRLWWSAYIRDALISLGLRLHPKLGAPIPMLTLDDFIPDGQQEDSLPSDGYDRGTLCVRMAELCLLINQIMSDDDLSQGHTEQVDLQLRTWLRHCTLSLQPTNDPPKGITVGRLLLNMTYHTVVSTLHLPHISQGPDSPRTGAMNPVSERNYHKVQAAAYQVSVLANIMLRKGLVGFVPTQGITCVLPAASILLLNLKSPSRRSDHHSADGLRACMCFLERLGERYAASESCDERTPRCSRCVERNVPCEYPRSTTLESSPPQLDSLWHQVQNLTIPSPNYASSISGAISTTSSNVSPRISPFLSSNYDVDLELLQAKAQPTQALNSTELELLSHYLSHTARAIAFDSQDLYVLKVGFPNLAFRSKPLMSSVLALAAVCKCHDIITQPGTQAQDMDRDQIRNLLALADQHHGESLRQTQAEIPVADYYDHVLANAPLMVLYASASHCVRIRLVQREAEDGNAVSEFAPGQSQWISLIRAAHLAYTGLLNAPPDLDSPGEAESSCAPSLFCDLGSPLQDSETILGEDGPTEQTRNLFLPILSSTSGPALDQLRSRAFNIHALEVSPISDTDDRLTQHPSLELQACFVSLEVLSNIMDEVFHPGTDSPHSSLDQSAFDASFPPMSKLSEVSPWLRSYLARVTSATLSRPLRRTITSFLNRVPAEYLRLVQAILDVIPVDAANQDEIFDQEWEQSSPTHQLAMDIFAHWLVLVLLLDGVWWLGEIGNWELERVVSFMSSSFDLRAPLRRSPERSTSAFSPSINGPSPDGTSTDAAEECGDEDEIRSRGEGKRRRLTTTDFTRRKRAVTACHFCRMRKTKCDNVRPKCGYCVRQKAKCVYGDGGEGFAEEDGEEAVTNRQLMDRLEEIKEMLQRSEISAGSGQNEEASLLTPDAARASAQTPLVTSPWARFAPNAPYEASASVQAQRDQRERFPFETLRCESLLRWPALRSVVPSDALEIDSELVFELGLKPSALENFSYPHPFPSPPEGLSSQETPRTDGSQIDPDEEQRQVDERGWCYYLSEISIRRTIDETLNVLYRQGEEYWMKNPSQLIRQYHECEQQITQWHYHLPDIVQFDDDTLPEEEFAAALQGRAALWREYTLRPILYYVLHHQGDDPIPPEAQALAAKEMSICAGVVYRLAFHRRHGGTWLTCRKSFMCACLILTAAVNPHRVEPPEGWHRIIAIAVQTLRRWEGGAVDLGRMADMLRDMYFQEANIE
ncbi:hypothetical protein ACJ41O_007586 [Fusarium nematophilum]